MYLYSRRMGRKAMKRASLFLILTLLLASLITGMPSFAGINDVTAEGFGIAANNLSAGWTTGNLGKTFQEGEWVAFQITVRNLDWEQLPYIGARFDFYDDARFYDLIRNISVGATPLDDTQGYPDALGDPAPIGTMAELNLAQRNPEEYYFDGFTPVVIPPENWGDQLNVFDIEGNVGSETDETRVFFITREQIQAADPSLIGSDTLVLYFQLHLARSWLWENTSTFDVGGTDYTLPLAYAYTYPPTDKWGGYVYDESFLSMTMPGSGAYPGSSGHSYVLMPGGEKTLPIPDLAEPEGMISGYKYEDTNGNGVYDMGIDLPIEGWPIYLRTDLYALEDIEFSTMTDENGYFFFENLPYNLIWEITEGSMEGYSQLAPNADSPTDGVYDPDGDVETTRWMKAFDFGFEGREPWGWSVKLSNDNRYRENVNFLNGTYGSLTVTKEVLFGDTVYPDDYFNGTTFDITLTGPSYPTGDTQTFTYPGDLEYTWEQLIPGEYTLSEDTLGNEWSFSVSADPVVIDPSEDETATVTNTYVPGSLEVTKVVNLNDVIGSPTIPSFDITITGPSYPSGDTKTASYPDGLVLTWNNLIPGDYTVSEGALGTEWDVTIPAGPVTVVTGQQATATVTNDYVPGSLEVTKVVNLNDVIGSPTIPSFEITITGPSYPSGDMKTATYPDGLVLTWSNLIPGDYTVSEGALGTEWDVTIPAGPVTVVTGQKATATVTNDYVPGSLKVTKSVDLGDTIVPEDYFEGKQFEITITGPSYPGGDSKMVTYPGDLEVTWNNLIPGFYTVTETDPGSMWTVEISGSPAEVITGQQASASVKNTFVPGSLEITKHVSFGGAIVPEGYYDGTEFDITITGPSYPSGNTKTATYPGTMVLTWNNLIPGDYQVTEEGTGDEWDVTVPTDDVIVVSNQKVTADVYNDLLPGSLEVTKEVILGNLVDPEGLYDSIDFKITITGPSYPTGDTQTFNYPSMLSYKWDNLIPGEYTVTEENPGSEWKVVVPAGAITVDPSEDETAEVTNTFLPGSLEVTKEVILGNLVDPEGLYDSIDFKITITGPSYPTGDTQTFNYPSMLSYKWDNLIPGDYTVTEENPGSEWKVEVPAGAINVAPDEEETATVTNTFLPAELRINKFFIGGFEEMIPAFIEVRVTGSSYPTGEVFKVDISGTEGTLLLENLLPGEYLVEELTFEYSAYWKSSISGSPATLVPDGWATVNINNVWAYTDETAWGYLPDHAIPFTDLDKKLKNWGWTNGPLDEGSYTMDLIAGAGGNDLSAGMKVGEVYVEIERVTSSSSIVVRVTYDTTTEAMSYLMTESHLWVGTTELPLIRNKMTNAPGQFPYGDMEDGYKYEFTVEIPDPGGEVAIYVAAHAVVQIPIDD